MARTKVHELRTKSKGDLVTQLNELKVELALRVAKVNGGAPNKLSKIQITVISQKHRATLRELYKKKLLPLDLEDPRHQMPPHQAPGNLEKVDKSTGQMRLEFDRSTGLIRLEFDDNNLLPKKHSMTKQLDFVIEV